MTAPLLPYAPVILRLLQGVLYHDDDLWEKLHIHQTAVSDHFAAIGLTLVMAEVDGFAYLRQDDPEDPSLPALPRLIRRIPLSFHVTLLGVLLRERLDELETAHPDSTPVITRQELYELLMPYMPERGDQRAVYKKMDAHIQKIADLGFLRTIKNDRFEIRNILKAKFDSERLSLIKAQLHTATEESADDE
jgi:hypothetical protein